MIYVGTKVEPVSSGARTSQTIPSSPLIVDLRQDGTGKDEQTLGEFGQETGITGRSGFEPDHESSADYDADTSVMSHGGMKEVVGPQRVRTPGDDRRLSDELELLESAEKKAKFWRGKGRARGTSRTVSDDELDPRVSRLWACQGRMFNACSQAHLLHANPL